MQTLILSKISNMNTMLFLNGQDWLIVLILVLLLFGGKKILELMRGLGRGVREFNDAKNNVKKEIEEGMKEKDQTSTQP